MRLCISPLVDMECIPTFVVVSALVLCFFRD